MKIINSKYLFVLLIFSLLLSKADAQQIQLIKSVFGNGGGKMAGVHYAVNGTVGQTFIGNYSNNISLNEKIGFWHQTSGKTTSSYSITEEPGNDANVVFEAYPNPFKSTVNIHVAFKNQERVSIKIYDTSGIEIKTIVEETLPGNEYKYYFNSGELPNGIYYCHIVSDNFNLTKKLSLIR